MPTFDVLFQVIVAGLGTRQVTISVVATDAAQAIGMAQNSLVQVQSIGVQRTAP